MQTTVASAQTKHTILVGDDTDLRSMQMIFSCLLRIHRHPKLKRYGAYNSAWLGEHLLFMHAVFGCETTRHLFGLGKGIVVKKLSDSHFYKCAETFTKNKCEQRGHHFREWHSISLLYGGSCAEGLHSLRYKWFCDKVSKSTPTYFRCSYIPYTSYAL